jgi:deaminated glutathione amidase
MIKTFRAAAIQMSSGADKAANLTEAARLVEAAAADGAQLIALPEMFNCLASWPEMLAAAEPIPGPTSEMLSELACRLKIVLVGGSFCEKTSDSSKVYNTSLLFDAAGRQLAIYRKIHLFDVELPGQVSYQESNWLAPGDRVVATDTNFGRIGQAICYDLRFGELFLRLSNPPSDVICLPAAFTATTGRAHWEILLRARAIENQAYVIAPNQCGQHTPSFETFGHSAIVDPWGTVLAMADDGPRFIAADIDLEQLQTIRARLPALAHRRALDPNPRSENSG